jgi:hypothetical protein
VIPKGTLPGLVGIVLLGILLGGCSLMGSLSVGDVIFALQNGIATTGSHVALFIH